jgi:CubicO group peptidase (beta-lactamase class C family)
MRDTVRRGLGGSLLSKSFSATTVCVALLALSACGGGGGGGGGGGSTPPPSSGSNPPPPPANTAPTVDAGAAQTIQLPTNQVQLQGTATDKESSTLTLAWSQTAGPTGVTFDDAAAASTVAHFPSAGTYTLSLSANDGSLSASDTVDITVSAAGNTAPTVSAGDDQTVVLPNNTAALQGSATDAENDALTYSWTQTAGPSGVTFDDATAAATTAHFPGAGQYELTLTASDASLSGADVVAITVSDGSSVFPDDGLASDPKRGWYIVNDPAEVAMDGSKLAQAEQYSQIEASSSGAIIRKGKVAYYWGGTTPDQKSLGAPLYDVKSTTKSMGSVALGLALLDGKIGSINDPAQQYLPDFGRTDDPANPNDPGKLASITLLQLATHTAGFEKDGGYCHLQYDPGTTWAYSDCGLNWLADVLTNVYQQDLLTLTQDRVWKEIGLTSADLRWRANNYRLDGATSTPPRRELAAGITANINAMARLGLLFLNNGNWKGKQILPQSFVQMVQTPPAEVASATNPNPDAYPNATTSYGVLWWTNKPNAEGVKPMPNVPEDAFWAWGLGDSVIVVIPSKEVVIARAQIIKVNDRNFETGLNGREGWNGDASVLEPLVQPVVESIQQ